jgi:hypothetical protein
MEELIPLGLGLLLGAVLGLVRPSLRLSAGAPVAVLLGATATIVTGEAEISWAYLLFDIPLVAVAATLGLAAGRALRRAREA